MAIRSQVNGAWSAQIGAFALAGLVAFGAVQQAPAGGDEAVVELRGNQRREGELAHRSPIRLGVNLVVVPVTVTDRDGMSIVGLDRTSFSVFEDGAQQPIASFSSEDTPCSIGVVLDVSGSMKSRMSEARAAIRAFLDAAHPEDEAFLMTFSNRPALQASFTTDLPAIPYHLVRSKVGGATALVDSVYFALQQMRTASHPRRALVLVSDGRDNRSRYSKAELIRIAMETDVQVYTIGLSDNTRTKQEFLEDRSGLALLESLSNVSGGLHHVVRNVSELDAVATRMGRALHNQYVVGYYAPSGSDDGKWRKIRVKVTSAKERPGSRVSARRGYFSPAR
jgi:Ca-activated chloride channel homolog